MITLEPMEDGSFDNRDLKLIDSSKNIYSYIAIDPTSKQNWIAYDVKGSPLTTRNIAYHVTYENSKIVNLEPSTEDGKLNFSLTSEGSLSSSKIENYNPFPWSGSGVKFRVLFEVKEDSYGLTLKYKDFKPIPIKPKSKEQKSII